MKKIRVLNLSKVNNSKLSQENLKKLKAGSFCMTYNCQCHGTTFTDAMTQAVLDYDSRA